MGLGGLVVAGSVGLAPVAWASVPGSRGLEIEGARDRRGFYIGGGVGIGATRPPTTFAPIVRFDLVLGAGVTQRFTLGADLYATPVLRAKGGVAFGGDIEGTGYIWRGLFARLGVGAAGVPAYVVQDSPRLRAAIGGAASVGYAFFVNASVALAFAATYDLRYVPATQRPRQSLLAGLRMTWF